MDIIQCSFYSAAQNPFCTVRCSHALKSPVDLSRKISSFSKSPIDFFFPLCLYRMTKKEVTGKQVEWKYKRLCHRHVRENSHLALIVLIQF